MRTTLSWIAIAAMLLTIGRISIAQPTAAGAPTGATPAPGAGSTPNQTNATRNAAAQKSPVPNNYFQKLHPLLPSCLHQTLDPNGHTITGSRFGPALHPPRVCPAGSDLVPSTNAADIVKALDSDADYKLVAVGNNKIAIYLIAGSLDPKTNKIDPSRLIAIEDAVDELSGTDFSYTEIVSVPVGKAKEIAGKVGALNGIGITAVPLNGDTGSSILLESKSDPNRSTLADLKQRIFDLRWEIPTAAPAQRLFHLNAPTVAKSLSGSAGGGDSASSADTSSSKTASSTGGTTTSTVSPSISVTVAAPGSIPAADSSKPPDGTNTTGTMTTTTAPKPAAPATKTVAASESKSSDAGPKPLDMKAVNDTLVYSNADGTDNGISERNRLMAVLDLPRPEVLLNMWMLQASSRDYRITNTEAEAVRGAVVEHNQLLQDAIDSGWSYLSREMKTSTVSNAQDIPGFFNPKFYNYITQKFVLGTDPASDFG